MAQQVTQAEFDEVVGSSEVPVLVDFWAEWCGPCKQMNPVLDELGAQWGDSVKVIKVNVDHEGELAQRFSVMSIPTFVVLRDGTETARLVGARPAAAMRQLIDSQL